MAFLTFTTSLLEFSEYSKHFGYLGIFIFFVTVDQLTPIPEELTLLTIGYLSSTHVFNPFVAGFISLSAFLSVDLIYFYLSRSGNKFITKIMTKRKNSFLSRYKKKLHDHFGFTLIALCFIPRMRLFAPVLAGMMNLPVKKFIVFDTVGLVLFTFVYISLGMVFHNSIHLHFEKFQRIFLIAALLFVGVLAVLFFRSARQE